MNPAVWKPLQSNTPLRGVVTIAFPIRSSVRSAVGQRLVHHSSSPTTTTTTTTTVTPCTNTVRRTLYNVQYRHGTHPSRLASLHSSSSLSSSSSSRLSSMIRRGFADHTAATSSKAAGTGTGTGAGSLSNAPVENSSGPMDKFKQLVKRYGYTGVVVYLGVSMIDLAVTFVVVKAAGMEKIERAQDWVVDHIGSYFGYKHDPNHHHSHASSGDHEEENKNTVGKKGKEIDLDKVDDEQVGAIYNGASGLWSVFVIAYGIHKLMVPLRLVATSVITPPLVKWLVKKGWIKVVAKKGAAVTAGTVEASTAAAAAAGAGAATKTTKL